MYESFKLDYNKYYFGGKKTAEWVIQNLERYTTLKSKNILDWGCGPGRVIRHIPKMLGYTGKYFGTDYNKDSINWCKEHIGDVNFNCNNLKADLPYEDNFFDAIYGISIFTHLSREMHYNWLYELNRILKPGGNLLVTTQGENFKSKLTQSENSRFEKGELIVRGKVKEGHRTYSAFHPDSFLYSLFGSEFEVLEKKVEPASRKDYQPQDTWILMKI